MKNPIAKIPFSDLSTSQSESSRAVSKVMNKYKMRPFPTFPQTNITGAHIFKTKTGQMVAVAIQCFNCHATYFNSLSLDLIVISRDDNFHGQTEWLTSFGDVGSLQHLPSDKDPHLEILEAGGGWSLNLSLSCTPDKFADRIEVGGLWVRRPSRENPDQVGDPGAVDGSEESASLQSPETQCFAQSGLP